MSKRDHVCDALTHALQEVPVGLRRELADALAVAHDEFPDSRTIAKALLSRAQPDPVAYAVVDHRGRVEDGRISRHKDKAEHRRAALSDPSAYRVLPLVFGNQLEPPG